MNKHRLSSFSLLSMAAASIISMPSPRYGVLVVNDEPMPPRGPINPISRETQDRLDLERIEAAQAKRERKAARRAK